MRRRQSHAYSNADGDTYTNANADSYRNSYSDGHGHGYSHSHSNSHSHSHGDTHTDGNADSYSHGNSNGHSHGHADSNSASCVANPNGHAQTDADAQAAADESSTGRALSGTLKAGTRERHLAEFPRLRWKAIVAAARAPCAATEFIDLIQGEKTARRPERPN